MNNLLNFVYIPLDIFRKMPHNELTELDAWLYFLGSDHPQDILRITEKYPMFCQLYQEIIYFRYHPKELIPMYSEALRIMEHNAVLETINDLKDEISQLSNENTQLNAEIQRLREELTQYNNAGNKWLS